MDESIVNGPVVVRIPKADPHRMAVALFLAEAIRDLARSLTEPTAHVTISNCEIHHQGPGPAISVGEAPATPGEGDE